MNRFERTIRNHFWLGTVYFALTLIAPLSTVTADTFHVPDEYPTIQAAIDASVDGDVVLVADGVYTGDGNRDMDFGGRAITVRSENGAATCMIDIQGTEFDPHRAFYFHHGETNESVVEGFTIQNGFATLGGGAALCEYDASPRFQSCVFVNNRSVGGGGGGAVRVYSATPTFIDCLFDQNQAIDGGGGGAIVYKAPLEFGFSAGGLLIDCVFTRNSATGTTETFGGAVGGANLWGTIRIERCVFNANQADLGGALYLGLQSGADLIECTFSENTSTGRGGGAIWFDPSGWLVALPVTAIDCRFIANYAPNGAGGGVLVVPAIPDRPLTLVNCLLSDNHSLMNGGALALGELPVDVINCTLISNSSEGDGGAIDVASAEVQVRNSIVWNNSQPQIELGAGTFGVAHTNVQGGWEGEGNIDEDPLFVDSDNDDFRLAEGSPCIDAGNNNTMPEDTDLGGNPRLVDDVGSPDMGEGEAPMVDMGAYEFQDYSPGLRLRLRTSCPDSGPARIGFANATANRPTVLLYAGSTGSIVIPDPYPCAGTQLGLGLNRLQIAWQGNAAADGSLVLNVNALAAACGGYLQLIDVASCETTNVVRVE